MDQRSNASFFRSFFFVTFILLFIRPFVHMAACAIHDTVCARMRVCDHDRARAFFRTQNGDSRGKQCIIVFFCLFFTLGANEMTKR